jgi:type I restriction enzyme S subunit
VVRANQFILSRIDARNGAAGIVPEELDGAVVSSDFPTFDPVPDRLLPSYLGWLSKTKGFVDACRRASEGTTNRVRLKEDVFLRQLIPLPPTAEQRRIVGKVEHLARKLEEAIQNSTQSDSLSDGFLKSVYRSMIEKSPRMPLAEVAKLERRPADITEESVYPGVSVRSFGRGCFHNPPLYGAEVTWQKPHLVREGDILVSNIKAWEGAIAVARPEDDGRFGSHRYLTFRPVDGVATPRFLVFHLLSEEGLYDVGMASPGSADRNRTLRSREMLAIQVPVPDYKAQVRFDALVDRMDQLACARRRARREIEAILPSILDRAFRGEL